MGCGASKGGALVAAVPAIADGSEPPSPKNKQASQAASAGEPNSIKAVRPDADLNARVADIISRDAGQAAIATELPVTVPIRATQPAAPGHVQRKTLPPLANHGVGSAGIVLGQGASSRLLLTGDKAAAAAPPVDDVDEELKSLFPVPPSSKRRSSGGNVKSSAGRADEFDYQLPSSTAPAEVPSKTVLCTNPDWLLPEQPAAGAAELLAAESAAGAADTSLGEEIDDMIATGSVLPPRGSQNGYGISFPSTARQEADQQHAAMAQPCSTGADRWEAQEQQEQYADVADDWHQAAARPDLPTLPQQAATDMGHPLPTPAATAQPPAVAADPADPWSALQRNFQGGSSTQGSPTSHGGHTPVGGPLGRPAEQVMVLEDSDNEGTARLKPLTAESSHQARRRSRPLSNRRLKPEPSGRAGGWGGGPLAQPGTLMTEASEQPTGTANGRGLTGDFEAESSSEQIEAPNWRDDEAAQRGHAPAAAAAAAAPTDHMDLEDIDDVDALIEAEMAAQNMLNPDLAAKLAQFETYEDD